MKLVKIAIGYSSEEEMYGFFNEIVRCLRLEINPSNNNRLGMIYEHCRQKQFSHIIIDVTAPFEKAVVFTKSFGVQTWGLASFFLNEHVVSSSDFDHNTFDYDSASKSATKKPVEKQVYDVDELLELIAEHGEKILSTEQIEFLDNWASKQ